MRAAVFNGPERPVTIEHVSDPVVAPGELLIEIARCGICGSDISMTEAGPFALPTGSFFGHEFSGEVREVGRGVSGVKRGDRVACLPCLGCGECEGCRGGNALFCVSVARFAAGFAEFIAAPGRAVTLLPASLSFADGALVEPIACGLHALHRGNMRGGERVLVLGAGSMGLAAVYWARRLNAKIVAVASRSMHRKDAALAMGADIVAGCDRDGLAALEAALGGPADIVVECVGKPGVLNVAIDCVRNEGTVISMGMCLQVEEFVPGRCAFKDVKLLFPIGYSASEFAETARSFDAGHINPELMIGSVVALESLPMVLEQLRSGTVRKKVQVAPALVAADG
jgi:threonine dehydrogenase-like Zn-dependent dehydrogenase